MGNRMRQVGQRGFTLIEVVVALAIATVMMGIAFPNMREFYEVYQLNGAASTVAFEIQRARLQAIAQSQCVKVSVVTSSPTLTKLCRVTAADCAGTFTTCDNDDSVVLPKGTLITGTQPAFTDQGMVSGGGASFTITNDGNTGTRTVSYNMLGRTTIDATTSL